MPATVEQIFREKHSSIFLKITPFILFCVIIGLITGADSLMSYTTPIYLEEVLGNEISMGLVLAFSSIIGFICDFLFSKFLREKTFIFFLSATLICAMTFPLILQHLPPLIPFLMLATGIWGIYYETLAFSNYDYIKRTFELERHEVAWGNLTMIKSVAWTFGPLAASSLLLLGYHRVYEVVVVVLFFAAILSLILAKKYHPQIKANQPSKIAKPKISFGQELIIWRVLLTRVWPLCLFVLVMYLVDATFWSIGTLFAQQIHSVSGWEGLFLTLYSLPSIVFSGLAAKAARPFGKKRIAFILGIFSGLALLVMGVMNTFATIIVSMTVFSSLFAITWPEINATFENYIERLDGFGIDLIGLKNSIGSLSYVIGPVLAGVLATLVGNQLSFALMGLLLLFTSIALLFIVPRKIRMPQQQLEEISD